MTRADDTLSTTPLVSGAPVIAQIWTLLWTAFLASILLGAHRGVEGRVLARP